MCLMIIDNLKVLECWSSIVWIRQNKRHQNVFACEFANFRVSQTEGFYNMLRYFQICNCNVNTDYRNAAICCLLLL